MAGVFHDGVCTQFPSRYTAIYILGTPSFEEVVIHLESGKSFSIKTQNLSPENYYVQSASMNGMPYEKSWISHENIVSGGELIVEMGPMPNKNWCSDQSAGPPDVMPK
ncbi:MAG: glycoside hydrolase family 92 protein [Cyclobacteriaceae bacterium]|nr:glycoside hydrolase family 92 protein [Cyclobacteriaceae bacterium]